MTLVEILQSIGSRVRRVISGPTMRMADDRRAVVVTWPDPPPARYTMSVERVEEMIAELHAARTQMLPAVPAVYSSTPGVACLAMINPQVSIGRDAFGEQIVLHWRDPGYGWLHTAFDRDQALDLGQAIINAGGAPAPEMRGRA